MDEFWEYHLPLFTVGGEERTFSFHWHLEKFQLDKFFSQNEISIFLSKVLNPLVEGFFVDNITLKDQNPEMLKSWFDTFDEVFPKYREKNNKITSFFSGIMNNIYFSTKKQLKENLEEEKQLHENPVVVEFIDKCKHILDYAKEHGKDWFKNGKIIGQYLFEIDKEYIGVNNQTAVLECKTHEKTVNFRGVRVKIDSACRHHLFFTTEEPLKNKLENIKILNEYIDSKFEKYTKPLINRSKLDLTTRQEFMEKLIKDGKPDYLEITDEWDVISWRSRVKFLDMEAKQAVDYDERKKLTVEIYQKYMIQVTEMFLKGHLGKKLKDLYEPDKIFTCVDTKETKTWKEFYNIILQKSHDKKSDGTLNDYFHSLN